MVKRFCRRLLPLVLLAAACARAAALSDSEFTALCTEAENREHCGRLVEAELIKREPALAERRGARLAVKLAEGAVREFIDREAPPGGTETDRNFSLWASYPQAATVVVWAQYGELSRYFLMSRESGLGVELAAEPVASPDEQRYAVADVCAKGCTNEIAIWEARDGRLKRTRSYSPGTPWRGAEVVWKDARTLSLEIESSAPAAQTLTLTLDDLRWRLDD
jgi:hypothetical protein